MTGFAKDKAEKRYFIQQRWLPAVNAQREPLGQLPWHFIEVTDIERIKNQLTDEIGRISAGLDERAGLLLLTAAQEASLAKIWDNEEDEMWTDQ